MLLARNSLPPMRKLLALLLLLALAYAAWPAWSAWQLRAALKARDFASIERKVDWALLRANLKQTVAAGLADDKQSPGSAPLVQALNRTLGPIVADTVIETAVTPRTLVHVLAGRIVMGEIVRGVGGEPRVGREAEEDADPLAPRRLHWAFFESPTRFRVEVMNARDPDTRVVSILALQGAAWRLVDVFYQPAAPAPH